MGTINITQYSPVVGAVSDAGAFQSAFLVLQTLLNGNIDAANIKAGLVDKRIAAVEVTSAVGITSTNAAVPTVIATLPSATYEGSLVRFSLTAESMVLLNLVGGDYCRLLLWDDTAGVSLGSIATSGVTHSVAGTVSSNTPCNVTHEITPAAGARVYSIRGYKVVASTADFSVNGGAGGAGAYVPIKFVADYV